MNLDAVLRASVTLHQAGDPGQASRGYRQLVAAVPAHPTPIAYLGMALAQVGHPRLAVPHLRRASRLAPDDAAVLSNLGNALAELGRQDEAARVSRRAVALAPSFPASLTNAGGGGVASRVDACLRALACSPDYMAALVGAVAGLDALARHDEAGRWARRGVALRPAEAALHLVVADHAAARSDRGTAARSAQRALAVGQMQADALFRIGNAHPESPDDAGRAYRSAVATEPGFAAGHVALGSLELGFGYPRNAVTAYDRSLALGAATEEAAGNRLFALAFLTPDDPSRLATENRRWAAARASAVISMKARPRTGRLRLGYVSPEFVKHGYLQQLLPVLDRHDRSRIEIFAYSQSPALDRRTDDVRRRVDHWRDLARLSFDAQAEAIRSDGIDVLVNLTGYLAHQRTLFFRRMAPVQIAYINHVSPTGMPTIDGRITDAWLEPTGAPFIDPDEQLLRFDSGFATYAAPDAPPLSSLPVLAKDTVTFGVFNNIAKASDEALAAWAAILAQVPGARLLIKGYGLSAERARRRIMTAFDDRGIDLHRIELVGRVADDLSNLATVARADIALDPFPFNGGLSTIEALWMGVPVVSLSGPGFVHRIGLTFLARSGLGDLVAGTTEDYIARAVALAADRDTLARLRAGMRERLSASLLFDTARHTSELEAAFAALLEERR